MTRDELERMLANPMTHAPSDALREAASATAALWEKAFRGDRAADRRYCAAEREYLAALGRCQRRAVA